MSSTSFLPQFGFTEAVSYNHENLKGFAPVVVGQVFSTGVFSKAGIQYAHIRKYTTIFTWLVCETFVKSDLDYFLMFRYTPKLTESANLFLQGESVNTVAIVNTKNFSFTQRLRLGVQLKAYQVGVGADFTQIGTDTFTQSFNVGGFIRHEF